jgi:hypothetical protein
MLGDFVRQRAFAFDRALQCHQDRDLEIIEQTDEMGRIRLEAGAQLLVELRQKKALQVDDRAAALIGNDALDRFHVDRARG